MLHRKLSRLRHGSPPTSLTTPFRLIIRRATNPSAQQQHQRQRQQQRKNIAGTDIKPPSHYAVEQVARPQQAVRFEQRWAEDGRVVENRTAMRSLYPDMALSTSRESYLPSKEPGTPPTSSWDNLRSSLFSQTPKPSSSVGIPEEEAKTFSSPPSLSHNTRVEKPPPAESYLDASHQLDPRTLGRLLRRESYVEIVNRLAKLSIAQQSELLASSQPRMEGSMGHHEANGGEDGLALRLIEGLWSQSGGCEGQMRQEKRTAVEMTADLGLRKCTKMIQDRWDQLGVTAGEVEGGKGKGKSERGRENLESFWCSKGVLVRMDRMDEAGLPRAVMMALIQAVLCPTRTARDSFILSDCAYDSSRLVALFVDASRQDRSPILATLDRLVSASTNYDPIAAIAILSRLVAHQAAVLADPDMLSRAQQARDSWHAALVDQRQVVDPILQRGIVAAFTSLRMPVDVDAAVATVLPAASEPAMQCRAAMKTPDWEAFLRFLPSLPITDPEYPSLVKRAIKRIVHRAGFSPDMLESADTTNERRRIAYRLAAILRRTLAEVAQDRVATSLVTNMIERVVQGIFSLARPRTAAMVLHEAMTCTEFASWPFEASKLQSALYTLTVAGKYDLALPILNSIPEDARIVGQYTACLTVFKTPTTSTETESRVDAVWQDLLRHPRLVPDRKAFRAYIAAKTKWGKVEDVRMAIGKMDRLGLLPDSAIDTYLEQAKVRAGDGAASGALVPSKHNLPTHAANFLLSSVGRDVRRSAHTKEAAQMFEEQELLDRLQLVQRNGAEPNEVTRNILVRQILQRHTRYEPADIFALRDSALRNFRDTAPTLDSFIHHRQPLYRMLIVAMRRCCNPNLGRELAKEMAREKRTAREFTEALEALGSVPGTSAAVAVRSFLERAPTYRVIHLKHLRAMVEDPDAQGVGKTRKRALEMLGVAKEGLEKREAGESCRGM